MGRATAGWTVAGAAVTLATGLLGTAAPPASAAPRQKPLLGKPFELRMPPKVHRDATGTTSGARSGATSGTRAGATPGATPGRTSTRAGGTLQRRYSTLGSPVVALGAPAPIPTVGPLPSALPTFTKSFTSNGSSYTYRMVGTDPAGPASTTAVQNTLVPVSVRVGGQTVAPSSATLAAVTGSGLFTPRAFPGSTGQYGDAFLRTQFWSSIGNGSKAWHVTLAAPAVQPWLVLDVPPSAGAAISVNGVRVAVVDVDWFDAHVQDAVTAPPVAVLTQLLAGNVVLCKPFTPGAYDACGVGGYHSATGDADGLHTYSFQAYLHGSVFGADSGFHDLGPMSHELAEWFADPYVDNVVPAWRSPLAPQYGCLDELETGDPVVGRFLTIGGLTYSDEAYVWWFARTTPSPAWQHRYTWLNTFTTVSPSCTPS